MKEENDRLTILSAFLGGIVSTFLILIIVSAIVIKNEDKIKIEKGEKFQEELIKEKSKSEAYLDLLLKNDL